MNKITSHCILRNNRLSANGQVRFEQAGDVDRFLENAYRSLKVEYPRFYKMDRLGKLGFLTSEVLLPSGIKKYNPVSVSTVLSNAHSSLDTDLRYFESTKTFASPSLFVYTLPNIVAGEICIRHGIKGENTFFISEQFEADQITKYVDLVLGQDHTEACIAGWVDIIHNDAEVFLYLAEKKAGENGLDHHSQNIQDLYRAWNS